jgi:hypothetical protein
MASSECSSGNGQVFLQSLKYRRDGNSWGSWSYRRPADTTVLLSYYPVLIAFGVTESRSGPSSGLESMSCLHIAEAMSVQIGLIRYRQGHILSAVMIPGIYSSIAELTTGMGI